MLETSSNFSIFGGFTCISWFALNVFSSQPTLTLAWTKKVRVGNKKFENLLFLLRCCQSWPHRNLLHHQGPTRSSWRLEIRENEIVAKKKWERRLTIGFEQILPFLLIGEDEPRIRVYEDLDERRFRSKKKVLPGSCSCLPPFFTWPGIFSLSLKGRCSDLSRMLKWNQAVVKKWWKLFS